MSGTTDSFGTLSSGLLARKGEARPAMRSQANALAPLTEDLGWNDMGSQSAHQPAAAPVPNVLIERAALTASIAPPIPTASVSVPTATRLQRETAQGGKAAFTLRLDAIRHLKLRIATAITDRSAQDLVTQALDALLDAIPEVEALVAQLPRAKPAVDR